MDTLKHIELVENGILVEDDCTSEYVFSNLNDLFEFIKYFFKIEDQYQNLVKNYIPKEEPSYDELVKRVKELEGKK